MHNITHAVLTCINCTVRFYCSVYLCQLLLLLLYQ